MVYVVAYLIGQKLSVSTIRNYMSGIRFYLFSLGIATPLRLPPLAEQLLIGFDKGKRDAFLTASKKTRHAISPEMIKLLGTAIALR